MHYSRLALTAPKNKTIGRRPPRPSQAIQISLFNCLAPIDNDDDDDETDADNGPCCLLLSVSRRDN